MKKNVIIIILAILVLGLGGYLVFDKVLSNEDNEVKEENENKKDTGGIENNNDVNENGEESSDLLAAKNLLDKYYFDEYMFKETIYNVGYTEQMMRVVALKNINAEDIKSVSCDELYGNMPISTNFGNKYEINSDTGIIAFCEVNGSSESISYERLSNVYKKLFGNDKALAKEDFNFEKLAYDYNESIDAFVKLTRVFGLGGVDNVMIHGIQNVKKVEDKLIIDVGITKLTLVNSDDWKTIINGEELTFASAYEDSFKQQFLNQYLDKMDTYTFTFFEEDGVYKLESMVKA